MDGSLRVKQTFIVKFPFSLDPYFAWVYVFVIVYINIC